MMADKFTPGPWKICDSTDELHAVRAKSKFPNDPNDEYGRIICDVGYGFTDEENIANGKLISAATDMLRALIIAEKMCGSLTSDQCSDSIHIAIKDAIEKATGFRS